MKKQSIPQMTVRQMKERAIGQMARLQMARLQLAQLQMARLQMARLQVARSQMAPLQMARTKRLAMSFFLAGFVATSALPCNADAQLTPADGSGTASKPWSYEDDVVLHAFRDELNRSKERLFLPNHPRPYFIAYSSNDTDSFTVYGAFGALDAVRNNTNRNVDVDVRVGDYKFDNSGGSSFLSFFALDSTTSLDNNYDAVRNHAWLATDSAYKRAIEAFEGKKAALQEKKIEDLPDSMSKAPAITAVSNPGAHLDIDREYWKQTVREISKVFRSFPGVIDSNVVLLSTANTRRYLNSEGTLNFEGGEEYIVTISATGQAKDGMKVSAEAVSASCKAKDLPDRQTLIENAKQLGQRVTDLAAAEMMEEYRGPILFEKQASAEFFAQTLAPQLVVVKEPFGESAFKAPVIAKLGRRILPKSVTIVDDPLVEDFDGKPLMGGYVVDDEGVKARKVTLVEGGILKTLCSSRTPSRKIKESNGHLRSGVVTPSRLFVTSSDTVTPEAMKEKLLQMGKDEGLDYVLIARNIESGYLGNMSHRSTGYGEILVGRDRGELRLMSPTQLFKVSVKDGKETLVRGAKFERLTHRLWRDIVAFGDDTAPYPVVYPLRGNTLVSSLVAPSVLVSEIDIERESHESDTPMLLKNAYFDQDANKKAN
jgi:Predicted Zn-dependent proteases and their inactivated homologs